MFNIIDERIAQKKSINEQTLTSRRQMIILAMTNSMFKDKHSKIINQIISLVQDQPFFQSVYNNYKFMLDFCKKITYEHYREGDIIYQYKKPANCLFLLLKGTVHLTIQQQIYNEDQKVQAVHQNLDIVADYKSGRQRKSSVQLLSQFLHIKPKIQAVSKDKVNMVQSNLFLIQQQIVRIVQAGQSFGQMLGEHSLRTSNAVAIEPCHLLVINRRNYDNLLTVQHKTQQRAKYMFLSSLPYLKYLSSFAVQMLCMIAKVVNYSYGQYLFKDQDKISNIFIIRQGQFRLMKCVPKLTNDSVKKKMKNQTFYKKVKIPQKQIPFKIIHAGQIIGDGQTLIMKNKYSQICVCQSQTSTVYSISKSNFFKILMQSDDYHKIQKCILQKVEIKDNLSHNFMDTRMKKTKMNILLNTNQSCCLSRQNKSGFGRSLNVSFNTTSKIEMIKDQTFFINQINKTTLHTPKKNRFSFYPPKCKTQQSQSKNDRKMLLAPQKISQIPHCIRDIVYFVKRQANFQRKFHKQRKLNNNLFEFSAQNVPLYIKSKFNKLSN